MIGGGGGSRIAILWPFIKGSVRFSYTIPYTYDRLSNGFGSLGSHIGYVNLHNDYAKPHNCLDHAHGRCSVTTSTSIMVKIAAQGVSGREGLPTYLSPEFLSEIPSSVCVGRIRGTL